MGVIGFQQGPGGWVFSLQKVWPLGPLPWPRRGRTHPGRTSESLSRLAAFFFSSWGTNGGCPHEKIQSLQVSLKSQESAESQNLKQTNIFNFNIKKRCVQKKSLFDRDHYIYIYIFLVFSFARLHPYGLSQKHHLLKRCMIESFENTISPAWLPARVSSEGTMSRCTGWCTGSILRQLIILHALFVWVLMERYMNPSSLIPPKWINEPWELT